MAYLVDPLGRLQFVLGGSPSGNEHKFGAWPTDGFGNILAELEASQSRIFVNGFARNPANGLLIIDPSTAVNGFAMGMGITAAGALAIDNANADGGSRVQGVVISPTGRISSNGYPLLSILPGGPTQDQIATGSLIAQTGQVVSCSRALAAYCFGADGLLHLLGSNTVRVEPQGLLVEGGSTNVSLQSNALATSPWAIAGTATVTNNTGDVLDPAGGSTATKIVLPGSGTQCPFQSLAVAATTQYTISVWLRTLSGTATVFLNMETGGTAPWVQTCNVTSTWQRFQVTATSVGTSYAVEVGYNTAIAGQLNQGAATIYAWGCQVEALPFASSNINTTTLAVTRPADMVTVANPLNPSNPGTWRVGGTYVPQSTWANIFLANGGEGRLWSFNNVTLANSADARYQSSVVRIFQVNDNLNATKNVSASDLPSGSGTFVGEWRDAAGTLTTTPASGAPTGTGTGVITTQPTPVYIGSLSGGLENTRMFNGWVTSFYVDNK